MEPQVVEMVYFDCEFVDSREYGRLVVIFVGLEVEEIAEV